MRSLLVLAALLLAEEALARAGGGGGGGRGRGGIGNLFVLPVVIAYAVALAALLKRRAAEAAGVQKRAAADPAWTPENVQARVEHVYYRVQGAWMARDQTLAEDCMSERLYLKHKSMTDQMLAGGTKNILEQVRLAGATLVEAVDYHDDAKDHMWVHIEGSLIDYTISEAGGQVLKGSKTKRESFAELWKFVRAPHGWVLDEIDQKVQLGDLLRMRSSSERP